MPTKTRTVAPGPSATTVRLESGETRSVPAGWSLLPPGDAGLTRRVKAAGPTWTVCEKKGRRMFSRGVWAPTAHIEAARQALEGERATPAYQKKLAADRKRREQAQLAYVASFEDAVLGYLAFHPRSVEVAHALAHAVTEHAVPVGSGTVARTKRIPLEQRAEAAVIAWMRHQTTAYEDLKIARIKGERRRVRRLLAERSKQLLARYRRGDAIDPATCPLAQALDASG